MNSTPGTNFDSTSTPTVQDGGTSNEIRVVFPADITPNPPASMVSQYNWPAGLNDIAFCQGGNIMITFDGTSFNAYPTAAFMQGLNWGSPQYTPTYTSSMSPGQWDGGSFINLALFWASGNTDGRAPEVVPNYLLYINVNPPNSGSSYAYQNGTFYRLDYSTSLDSSGRAVISMQYYTTQAPSK